MGSKQSKKLSLIAVDTSPSMRALLAQAADACGFGSELCANLSEVRERLSGATFDLVITASELPDGTALDVLESVRANGAMALTPVLLLAGNRKREGGQWVQEALDRGMTEVFSKQDIDDLVHYLENFSAMGSAGKRSGGSLRALVVEDDRSLGKYYKELLAQRGFMVEHVPSGEAALVEAERMRYDFILVDLVLSGSCSGIQFLRRLRQPAMASARSVAIAMSAYDDEARRIEALRAGANAFMPKPIQEHELTAHVAGLALRPSGEPVKTLPDGEVQPSGTCTRCQPCKLTPRESNICALVAAGYSDKRIAEEMGLSYWTVRTHIAHAFKKCMVNNRVELVRRIRGD